MTHKYGEFTVYIRRYVPRSRNHLPDLRLLDCSRRAARQQADIFERKEGKKVYFFAEGVHKAGPTFPYNDKYCWYTYREMTT